jgi:hypothetical protein
VRPAADVRWCGEISPLICAAPRREQVTNPTTRPHLSAVLELLDAELSEIDDQGRLRTSGKVAIVAVVGNENGPNTSAPCCSGSSTMSVSAFRRKRWPGSLAS